MGVFFHHGTNFCATHFFLVQKLLDPTLLEISKISGPENSVPKSLLPEFSDRNQELGTAEPGTNVELEKK